MKKRSKMLQYLTICISITLIFLLTFTTGAYADSWVADIDENMDNNYKILNHDPVHNIYYPTPQAVEKDGKLYVSWVEYNTSEKVQLRVCEYDQSINAWTFIDGDGENGLNFNPNNEVAWNISIAVSNGILYVAWVEFSPTDPNGYFSHISKYNGTPGNWTRIDSGTAYGIRDNTTIQESSPQHYESNHIKIVDNNKLYAAWSEYPYGQSNANLIIKSYDGTSWNMISSLPTNSVYSFPDMTVHDYVIYCL